MVRARCFSLVLLGLAVQSWGLPSSFILVSGVTSSQLHDIGAYILGGVVIVLDI